MTPYRTSETSPLPEPSATATAVIEAMPNAAGTEPSPPEITAEAVSLWESLRRHFTVPSCDNGAQAMRWAKIYTRNPDAFSASLAQAMPFLLLVFEQFKQHELPGEFVLLPYLESSYVSYASHGDRPAGIWQIVPDTGREFGLAINHDYDGRLDIYAASIAALTLLEQYQREFGDWRLTNMAFNAGKYRIKQLIARQAIPLDANELGKLKVSPTTHEHLAKLMALACIISDPQRFNVELPQPGEEDTLRLVEFGGPVDLRLAARIAQMDEGRLHQLNPAYLHKRMPDNGPFHLLLPAKQAAQLERIIALLPESRRRDWQNIRLTHPELLDVLAQAYSIPSEALAAINHIESEDAIPAGSLLLVPGREPAAPVHIAAATGQHTANTGLHTVKAGDTLWDIAHRYQLSIDDLLNWNNLNRSATLKLGQRLHLTAPR